MARVTLELVSMINSALVQWTVILIVLGGLVWGMRRFHLRMRDHEEALRLSNLPAEEPTQHLQVVDSSATGAAIAYVRRGFRALPTAASALSLLSVLAFLTAFTITEARMQDQLQADPPKVVQPTIVTATVVESTPPATATVTREAAAAPVTVMTQLPPTVAPIAAVESTVPPKPVHRTPTATSSSRAPESGRQDELTSSGSALPSIADGPTSSPATVPVSSASVAINP